MDLFHFNLWWAVNSKMNINAVTHFLHLFVFFEKPALIEINHKRWCRYYFMRANHWCIIEEWQESVQYICQGSTRLYTYLSYGLRIHGCTVYTSHLPACVCITSLHGCIVYQGYHQNVSLDVTDKPELQGKEAMIIDWLISKLMGLVCYLIGLVGISPWPPFVPRKDFKITALTLPWVQSCLCLSVTAYSVTEHSAKLFGKPCLHIRRPWCLQPIQQTEPI